MTEPISAKGHNGTVTFDGQFVTIERTGFLARASIGKGTKRIPVMSITAVQWKPPGFAVNGFIQFTVPGGSEGRSRSGKQTRNAREDENSVIVTKGQADDFLALRAAIEAAIAGGGKPASGPSIGEQIAHFAELHAAGALSDEEFATAKAKLLN